MILLNNFFYLFLINLYKRESSNKSHYYLVDFVGTFAVATLFVVVAVTEADDIVAVESIAVDLKSLGIEDY